MKIGIMGYFGYGNIGDEAILKYEISELKNTFPASNIVIVSNKKTSLVEYGNKTIPQNLSEIISEKFDLLLLGGRMGSI